MRATVNSSIADAASLPQLLRTLVAIDTESDGTLTDLVRMSAHSLRCPMVLISLVDGERRWVKASFGRMPEASETLGLHKLCRRTLLHNEVMVLGDLAQDAQHEQPESAGRALRFYAAAPLHIDGHRVGTLCVLDHEARCLDAQQRAFLADMALTVEHWFAHRREQQRGFEREREFAQLAEQMPGIVYRAALDAHSSTLYVSPRIRELGYTPEQWIARPDAWMKALHPDDRERTLAELAHGLAQRRPFVLHYRMCDLAGRWHTFEDSVREITLPGHNQPVIQGVMNDVSARETGAAARDQLFAVLPDAVLILDAAHRIVDANPQALTLLGRGRSEMLGQHIGQLMQGDGHGERTERACQALAGPSGVLGWDCLHPQHGLRQIEDTVRTLGDGGQVRVLRDVSQRREQESWLRKLSLAAEQASEAIVITDLKANIEYVNQAAIVTSGYTREELMGQNSRVLQSGLTPATRYRKLWGTLTAGKPWRGFFNNRRKDGTLYTEFAVISPVRDAGGQVSHFLAVKEDITEKRRMGEDLERYRHHLDELVAQRTAELERARRLAESASAAKSAFLAAMSHEIRTPMNGVIGIADVLLASSLTPHQQNLADTLRESAFALLSVIDDVLDFSKIEAGRLDLETEPLALRSVVNKACDTLRSMAAGRGVGLNCYVDPALPARFLGDAARLRQIILNLVGNAIKFSAGLEHPGRVSLRAVPGAGGGVRLVVNDNGIGMSSEVQQRLFQPFVQGQAGTTQRYGGTGLGLVICQRLVAAMGGAISVESQAQQGSTFSADLPLAALPDDGSETRVDLSGLHCWVRLADAELERDWASYLEAAGARVSFGPGLAPVKGETQVCIAEGDALCASEAPQVRVRAGQRGLLRQSAPGCIDVASDGLQEEQLLRAVALAVGRGGGAPSAQAHTGAAPRPLSQPQALPDQALAASQGRLVLVAEDNLINQKVIRHQLELLGLASEHVSNGQEALARWRAAPERYGLLLTDLHMPELDGFGLVAALRAEESAPRRLPVIALTANVLGGEDARCRAGGMDACLSKPVAMEKLRNTIQDWLPPAPDTAASDPAPDGLAPAHWDLARLAASSAAQETEPAFDDQVLARLVGPDEAVLLDLRKRFVASLDVAMQDLASLIAAGDGASAGLIGHRIKTSSRAIGALALGRHFETLEDAGREARFDDVVRCERRLAEAVEIARRHYLELAQCHDQTPRIFCVDDDADQLQHLMGQLDSQSVAQCEAFASGAELLARLRQGDSASVLLLIDLDMPGMDGVELIWHLAQQHFRGMLALVGECDARMLYTAERLARAHRLRSLGRMQKPVTPEALKALLARWPLYPSAAIEQAPHSGGPASGEEG